MTPFAPKPAEVSRDLLETGMEAAMLAVETHVVVSYRTSPFCGLSPLDGQEIRRMFLEKPPAFAAAALAAGWLTLSGQRPDRILAAALRPLRSETNRNLRRLGGETLPSRAD